MIIRSILFLGIAFAGMAARAQEKMGVAQRLRVGSPNHKIMADLFCEQGGDSGEWYLELSGMIPKISLGLVRNDQEFWKHLRFIRAEKPVLIDEQYLELALRALHTAYQLDAA